MLLPIALLAQVAVTTPPLVFSGIDRRLTVTIPRLDRPATVDGQLDEPAWAHAALLTGFTQFSPTDGIPAADSTQILVWYSATAIHFGIRAFESHGTPHATIADRDHIFADDNVQLLIGTFPGGQQATLFAVNALGQQGDGVTVESGNPGGGATGSSREAPDLSPDFDFQSKGELTPWGYQVEVRIPFRSLRYQSSQVQSWNLNIVREVKHSAVNDSWAPVRRASSSFLGQSGTLVDLRDIHRGLVMEFNPEFTQTVAGTSTPTGYGYRTETPRLGGNFRWGISNNVALNATVRPDFSQVESDAGQLTFDPRQALFFPEKRPFFLDGIELFQLPLPLVYTRRIADPVAALKITASRAGATIGVLGAIANENGTDDKSHFGILRAQQDLGGQSRLGVTYTGHTQSGDVNHLAGVDGRLLLGSQYSLQFQVAGSETRSNGIRRNGALWYGQLNANGRHIGLAASITGIGDDLVADAGFIRRPGVVTSLIDTRITGYGRAGNRLQSITANIGLQGNWQYGSFIQGRGIQDKKLHLNTTALFRGGGSAFVGVFIELFGYDPSLYRDYALEKRSAGGGLDTIPFTGQPTIPNAEVFVQFLTPEWRNLTANLGYLGGHDEDFYEWASGTLNYMHAELNWRPTGRGRLAFSYDWQQVNRRTDGTLVHVARIPRLKLEYQLTRTAFLRLVGEYNQDKIDSLRDVSRTEAPILIRGPEGYARTAAKTTNAFHGDALFSYQPRPGTLFFAGYGSAWNESATTRPNHLSRQSDRFFLKATYLFRF
ncbi:MAG: DUF5916 domain-containing protein [Gemmatimonadales bacterium]